MISRNISAKNVAILLSTYNGEKYIDELMQSLINQTVSEFTLFIRDDGSKDKTLELIKNYEGKIKTVYLDAKKNLGPANSFYTLAKNIPDEFSIYFFADQDDIWHPEKIELAITKLEGSKKDLYVSAYNAFEDDNKIIKQTKKIKRISCYNALCESIGPGCTMAFTKKLMNKFTAHEIPNGIMHDRWMYFIASLDNSVIYDTTPTINYRIHNNNTIGISRNIFQVIKRRLKNIKTQKNGIYSISRIASHFTKNPELIDSKTLFKHLKWLRNGKSNILYRIISAAIIPFDRSSHLDSILLRVMILANKY